MKKEDVQKLIDVNLDNYRRIEINSDNVTVLEYTELYTKILLNLRKIELDESYEIIEPSMTDFKSKTFIGDIGKNEDNSIPILCLDTNDIFNLFFKQSKVQSEEVINTQVELTTMYILEETYDKNEIQFLKSMIEEDKKEFVQKWTDIIINERTSLKQCIKEFQEDVIEYFNIEQLQKEYIYDILSAIEKVEEEYVISTDEEEIIEDIKEQFEYGELSNRIARNYIIRNYTIKED